MPRERRTTYELINTGARVGSDGRGAGEALRRIVVKFDFLRRADARRQS
jgi:hypothetical protein